MFMLIMSIIVICLQILQLLKEKPEALSVERWDTHELNPSSRDEKAIDWSVGDTVLPS